MISVGLIAPLVIRGIRGIVEINRRSDIVLRTSIVNGSLPMPLPEVVTNITLQDVRDYFASPGNREKFSDENKYPGFSNSLKVVNLSRQEARAQGLVKDENEYNSHLGSLEQLMISSPDSTWSEGLINLIRQQGINFDDPSLSVERKQELLLGFFMVGSDRSKAEFVAGKIALIVADVLAEIGSEYVGLVVKDRELSRALETFLKSLSESDLENLERDEFLRHVLRTTLVAISDNAEVVTDNRLLGSLIKSVAKEISGDVQTLLAGKLYGRLVTIVLAESAKHTDVFIQDELLSKVLSSVLDKAARELPVKKLFSEKGLEQILVIGLKSVAENKDLWIGEVDPPLLQKVIEGVVAAVQAKDANKLFKRETAVDLIDIAIGIIANNPGLITDGEVSSIIGKALEVISSEGVRNAFKHREAVLVRIVKEVLKEAGEKGSLLVKDEFAAAVLEAVLKSGADNIPRILSEEGLKNIIAAALDASASNVRLIKMKDGYKKVLEGAAKTLDKNDYKDVLQGKNLERIFIEVIEVAAKNIPFFVQKEEGRIIVVILDKLLGVAKNDPTGLLGGDELAGLIKGILSEISRNQDAVDKIVAGEIPLAQLLERALAIISAVGAIGAKIDGPRLVGVLVKLTQILLSNGFALPLSDNSIKDAIARSID